jgi:hypothetical protein
MQRCSITGSINIRESKNSGQKRDRSLRSGRNSLASMLRMKLRERKLKQSNTFKYQKNPVHFQALMKNKLRNLFLVDLRLPRLAEEKLKKTKKRKGLVEGQKQLATEKEGSLISVQPLLLTHNERQTVSILINCATWKDRFLRFK